MVVSACKEIFTSMEEKSNLSYSRSLLFSYKEAKCYCSLYLQHLSLETLLVFFCSTYSTSERFSKYELSHITHAPWLFHTLKIHISYVSGQDENLSMLILDSIPSKGDTGGCKQLCWCPFPWGK